MARGDREIKKQRQADVMEYLQERSADVKNADSARKNQSVTNALTREHLYLEQLTSTLEKVFADKLPVPKKLEVKSKRAKTSRILNLIFSDTHYGSNLDPREVRHLYGPVEEARRTAAICRQVSQYKKDHRGETELHLHLLGDIIQGQLHDMRDGAPLAEQVAAAMYILIQAIRFLSEQFPKVKVFCTPGNHGRNTARHRERATNQKWDATETHIYYALKIASQNLKNVTVSINYEPKYDFVNFADVGMATHGDTVLNPGFPGASIDVSRLKKQIDSINNARVSREEKPYSLFIMGHVHTGAMVHLPGGYIVITNGCLIPTDAYAQSIGLFGSACGQWMWESVEGHIVGDARFVKVDEQTDQDESLDDIIKPFMGLDK